MINIQEVLQEIMNGKMDPFRKQVMEAFKLRDRNKNLLPFDKLQPGMRVKLVGCKKELNGSLGTVVSKLKTMVIVDLDNKMGPWHKGVSCIPGQLEVLKQ